LPKSPKVLVEIIDQVTKNFSERSCQNQNQCIMESISDHIIELLQFATIAARNFMTITATPQQSFVKISVKLPSFPSISPSSFHSNSLSALQSSFPSHKNLLNHLTSMKVFNPIKFWFYAATFPVVVEARKFSSLYTLYFHHHLSISAIKLSFSQSDYENRKPSRCM
jgi:hypothetical protein